MIVNPGKRFWLKDFDPAYKGEYKTEEHARIKLKIIHSAWPSIRTNMLPGTSFQPTTSGSRI